MVDKVVIIDSGLDYIYKNNNCLKVCENYNIVADDDINNFDTRDYLGHGTAVSSIIFSINKETNFIIVKIFNGILVQDESILIKALKLVVDKKITNSIIHMSLGIDYYSKLLHDVCKEIYDNNNIIVSSFDNAGCISYPAAFDFVIGVEASDECKKNSDFNIVDSEIVDVYSKGGLHRVAGLNKKSVIKQGNSISAAYVTGFLTKFELKYFIKEDALKYLKFISTYTVKNIGQVTSIEKINNKFKENSFIFDKTKRVALFPYNKEISSIIKFSEMLQFDIEGIYTSKYLGNINQNISNFANNNNYIIKNIEDLNYKIIDVLIIGHLNLLENSIGKNLKRDLLENCLRYNVNVFSLDSYDISHYIENFNKNGLFLNYPFIENKNRGKRGKLYKIKTPILGVYGTSSKQGKFTLQLFLRKAFLEAGYNIAQLSTEPTGLLFGFEESFPFGFNSFNDLSEYDFIDTVNSKLHELDSMERDLIIVGCQSRTIAESFNHLGTLAIRQLEFLIATQPDAVLLCINPNDDFDYISRTINVIESITYAKVISLILYPFEYKNSWKLIHGNSNKISWEHYEILKDKYTLMLNIPCYLLEYDFISNIQELVINFFS